MVSLLLVALAVAGCADPATPAPAQGAPVPALAPDTGAVPVEGGAIHYSRAGSGPAVVLLHGWPQTSWVWHAVMPGLARDHTVIAIDLPGLGESSIPDTGFDKAHTARRVHQAIRALGYQQVAIVAHDIGGFVGFAYARDFPDEVSRLAVFESPLPGPVLDQFKQKYWHLLFNATPAPIPEQLINDADVPSYLGMFFSDLSPGDRDVYYRAYANPARRHAGYEYYRAFDADAADIRTQAATKQVTIPVLAAGAQRVFGASVAESFRPAARDVRTVVVPDSGHFVPEEKPAFVIDCVRLFLNPNAGRAPAQQAGLAGCTP